MQRIEIRTVEELDYLNHVDVILVLPSNMPEEQRSQILREGRARNFQFHQNKAYYETVYYCLLRNSEADNQELGPVASFEEHDQEADIVENNPITKNIQSQAELPPKDGMESVLGTDEEEGGDHDCIPSEGEEHGEKEQNSKSELEHIPYEDYLPSDHEDEGDHWLQLPFFEEEEHHVLIDKEEISDADYVPSDEHDPEVDDAEWSDNTDFMDDLYTNSETESDADDSDGDYMPSENEEEGDDHWMDLSLFFDEEEGGKC